MIYTENMFLYIVYLQCLMLNQDDLPKIQIDKYLEIFNFKVMRNRILVHIIIYWQKNLAPFVEYCAKVAYFQSKHLKNSFSILFRGQKKLTEYIYE